VPNKETGRNKRQMAGPETYRGIQYSVTKQADGKWAWKLHAKIAPLAPMLSGTAKGTQNNAIEAAHRSIDKLLGTARK
jgi:hypothetical protein